MNRQTDRKTDRWTQWLKNKKERGGGDRDRVRRHRSRGREGQREREREKDRERRFLIKIICDNLQCVLQQPDNDVDELGNARRRRLITAHSAVLQSAVKFLHSI